jgi:hypothetical protein
LHKRLGELKNHSLHTCKEKKWQNTYTVQQMLCIHYLLFNQTQKSNTSRKSFLSINCAAFFSAVCVQNISYSEAYSVIYNWTAHRNVHSFQCKVTSNST